MRHKVLLDCDPGHDDAIAMMLAWGSPEVELLGITTVGGNQTIEKVTRNALSVATAIGLCDVPIARGCAHPLVRPAEIASDFHGGTGLDGAALPEPAVPLDRRHAVDLIIETVMAHEPGTVTLVPTGPLTNIAMAVRKEPAIAERVRQVVLMGGGYHTGNQSPVAEFNIRADPEAAYIVFHETWPVVMVGLDLTHQALATDDVVAQIEAHPGSVSGLALGLLAFSRQAYRSARGFASPPVHDPCTLAYLIDPTIVRTVRVPIDIELTGTLTVGMTVADFRGPAPEDCHTWAATTLDAPRFWDLVVDAIDRIQRVVDA